jgi:hypothetical protein
LTSDIYYNVFLDERREVGLAYPIGVTREQDRPLIGHYLRGGRVENWPSREYELRDGGFVDYQPDVRGFLLCSERLRDVLEASKGPLDVVQWLPVSLKRPSDEARPYWILHFPERPDLLDHELSHFHEGRLLKGVLSLRKAQGHHVVPTLEARFTTFMVSATVREAILAADCTGIIFDPIKRVAP